MQDGELKRKGVQRPGLNPGPFFFFKFKDFIYLLFDRKGGRKRGRETSVCGCLLRAPYWGPGLQPRHVP